MNSVTEATEAQAMHPTRGSQPAAPQAATEESAVSHLGKTQGETESQGPARSDREMLLASPMAWSTKPDATCGTAGAEHSPEDTHSRTLSQKVLLQVPRSHPQWVTRERLPEAVLKLHRPTGDACGPGVHQKVAGRKHRLCGGVKVAFQGETRPGLVPTQAGSSWKGHLHEGPHGTIRKVRGCKVQSSLYPEKWEEAQASKAVVPCLTTKARYFKCILSV